MITVVEISTDERFVSGLGYIKKGIETALKRCTANIQCLTAEGDGRVKLLVMFDNSSIRELVGVVVSAIAEVVITDFKSYYIESRLNLPIEDPVNKAAFIKALSSFDAETDRVIAGSLIKLTPDANGEVRFLLDSFYEFMIDDLKNRWQEVCVLANDNTCFLVCNRTFAELLKFLISNIESLAEEAHLFARKDKIEVLGRDLRPFNVYINETLPPDIQVVNKLIAIAPKRIFIHMSKRFTASLVESIRSLFGTCVVEVSKGAR